MTDNIFATINSYETDFLTKPVKIVDGYSFSQRETIKRAHLYRHSQFEDGSTDVLGEKIFFNILTPRVRNSAKNIDLSTKDVMFRALNGNNYWKSWLYRRSAQQWMRARKFGRFLNGIPDNVLSNGTVVAKHVYNKNIVQMVDIRNLMNDQTTDCLDDSWVIEDHYYTPTELRQKTEWNKQGQVDVAIKSFLTTHKENYVDLGGSTEPTQGDAQYIRVREFYGDVPQRLIDDSSSDIYMRGQFVVIMPEGQSEQIQKGEKQGLILFRDKVKAGTSIYKELHARRISGRFLGIGYYEEGRELQVFKNEEMNAIRDALELSKLILFWTGDETVARNILQDLRNGDILKFKKGAAGIQRLDTRAHDNATNQLISSEIDRLTNALANSAEVTMGQTMPSGTPFALGQLLDQNANKLFQLLREDFGLFIQDIFEDWVMPEMEKHMTEEHILEITDEQEVKMLREIIVRKKSWAGISDVLMHEGRMMTVAEVEALQAVLDAQLASRDALFLDIPKGMLTVKDVRVDVGVEREDPAMLQSLGTVLQIVQQNPAALDNPVFQRILDTMGLSKLDFPMSVAAPAPAMAGSAAAPTAMAAVTQ